MDGLLSLQHYYQSKLKLAIIGQSLFGQEVYSNLRQHGHKVVGVFTVPDKDGKADPLGELTLLPSVFACWFSGLLSPPCAPAFLMLQLAMTDRLLFTDRLTPNISRWFI